MNRLSSAFLTAVSLLAQQPAAPPPQNDLFDPGILHEIRLTLHPRDWDALRANFRENTYYAADLRWRDVSLAQIGIRSRGAGSRNAMKPGLRLDFNRFTGGQRFLGLNALVLDNSMQDQSLVRERLSMLLFEKMGVPAPRVSFAKLYINGSYAGLYSSIEEINKDFLNRRMQGDSGWLYEYQWTEPYFYEDRGPDPGFYLSLFSPKTNEKDPRIDRLYSLIRFVGAASEEEFRERIQTLIDVPGYLRLAAVEAFLEDWDGQFGSEGINNFYVYLPSAGQPLRWIAWDKDVTFWDPAYPVVPEPLRNRLLARLLRVEEFRRIFYEELASAAELAGATGGMLDQAAEDAYTLIRAAVHEDTFRQATVAEFESDFSSIRDFLASRVESVRVQLAWMRAASP